MTQLAIVGSQGWLDLKAIKSSNLQPMIQSNYDVLNTFTSLSNYMLPFSQISGQFW